MTTTIFIGTELGLYHLEKTVHGEWLPAQNIFPGKRIVDIAASPKVLFAAVSGEGVFRSSNFGESWQPVFAGVPTCLQMDTHLWLGTAKCELYRSADGGNTWKNLSPALHAANNADLWYPPPFSDEPLISSIALSPTTQTVMVGIKNGGVVRSTNAGKHWSLTDETLDETVHRLHAHPTLPGHWIVGTETGIFFSDDDGHIWEEITEGVNAFCCTDVIISAKGCCFAATSETPPGNWVENSWSALFMATEPGSKWHFVSLPRAEYITVFAQIPHSPNIVFGTQSGTVYLGENGTEWQPIGLVNGAITALHAMEI